MLAAFSTHVSFHAGHAPWGVMLLAGAVIVLLLGAGAGILFWLLTRKP